MDSNNNPLLLFDSHELQQLPLQKRPVTRVGRVGVTSAQVVNGKSGGRGGGGTYCSHFKSRNAQCGNVTEKSFYNTRSAAKGNKAGNSKTFLFSFRNFSLESHCTGLIRDTPNTVYRKTIRNSMFNLLSAEDDHVEINKIVDSLKSIA